MTSGPQTAVLMVGHGSPRPAANEGFIALVKRVERRLGVTVLPTFFSIARPSIEDQVAALAARGVKNVVLIPYFLYAGQHVTKDIPALLDQCRRQYPNMEIQVLSTLENDPAVEDVVVEKLAPLVAAGAPLPSEGKAIERRSFEIIDGQMADLAGLEAGERSVIRRCVHATADLSFGRSMRIHPQAIERGRAALAAGKPILCDVRMLQAGITRTASEVLCAIGDADVIAGAKARGSTRAAAAMEKFRPMLEGAIVAVGNAPTALWKIMEIAASGGPRPALVVGLPVGFVGARESKLALIDSGLCYIANVTSRGGSPAAAAAVNALALMQKEGEGKRE